jgi:hypothetical protein
VEQNGQKGPVMIKSTSFPGGFIVSSSDAQQLATILTGGLQAVTAVVQFTDVEMIVPILIPL